MDDGMTGWGMELGERIGQRLVEVFGGRKWLCAAGITQEAAGLAAAIREFGASDVHVLAGSHGTGPLDESIPVTTLDLPAQPSMMAGIRAVEAGLLNVPPDIEAVIDAWDPDGEARSIGGILMPKGVIAGRRTFGNRPAEWAALEDKLLMADLFAAAGVSPPAATTVELSDRLALHIAYDELATDDGVVMAGDNRSGWHGGASSTRRVQDRSALEDVARELAGSHDAVRVMPFIEGVPCSIHGFVLADGTAAFRPMEMLVFRNATSGDFVYSKASSFWDPAPADREAMRSLARRVGDHLRERVGYRGVFTLDGVMGVDGFVATEINPRFGGALPARLHSGDPVLRLGLMHLAAVEGHFDDFDPGAIEAFVTEDLDAHRYGTALVETARPPDTETTIWMTGEAGRFQVHEVEPESGVAVQASWGPSLAGGLVFIHLAPDLAIRESVAALVLEARALAEQTWSLDLPDLEPPRVVR